MTYLCEMETALGHIIGEARRLEDYFTGPYSDSYSTIIKTRIRAKEIIKHCNTIIDCANKRADEKIAEGESA